MSETLPLRLDEVGLVLDGVRLLDRLSLDIGPGERVAIVGGSGTGKSLVARLAAGLAVPSEGTAHLFGGEIGAIDTPALRRLRLRCGLVLQGGSLFGDLSVEDNLRLAFGAGNRNGASRARRRIDRLLIDFHIEHAARQIVRSLSIGEQRRVELARAFLRDPELVILDEPFEGSHAVSDLLEAQVARQVIGRRRALLLLTQDVDLAGRLAQHIYRIERGRLVQQAPIASLPVAAS